MLTNRGLNKLDNYMEISAISIGYKYGSDQIMPFTAASERIRSINYLEVLYVFRILTMRD